MPLSVSYTCKRHYPEPGTLCKRATLSAMRVTKVSSTHACAVCERTLLLGERAVRFSPGDGAELVEVCPLCQEAALDAGWVKEGSPTTPTINGDRRLRRRLGWPFGLTRARVTEP